eukprot:gnl/TRDRNA2_/TRDRNA2_196503_c0_seq1.p1 gnl/TRDRNA2_/TRDRNA2_196503_c0~~gnl/TRDRNA2_/TRDRNA2_196503_c0_seq1.p1  ORF type:complete len:530 (-),score=119.96 gnl/TRDRNA2_/TRDRNA2_196503_c0_seq1:95-1684(-)
MQGEHFQAWAGWFADVSARSTGAIVGALAGRTFKFPSAQGLIVVNEEQSLAHLEGAATRARGCSGAGHFAGEEFDLRRLRAGADEGGLVSLSALEALEREAELMVLAVGHRHVVGSHSTIIENENKVHCKMLLCDPTVGDLAALLAEHHYQLPAARAAEVCQQLVHGLGYLHRRQILGGPAALSPAGVLLGRDGLWKIGDFSQATRLPMRLGEWCHFLGDEVELELSPPEVQNGLGRDMEELTPLTDMWLLGQLLATMILGDGKADDESWGVIAMSPQALLDPLTAYLWLLMNWLMATEVSERPGTHELAEHLSTEKLAQMPVQALLAQMPQCLSRQCRDAATSAARQLALDEIVLAVSSNEHCEVVDRFARASLAELCCALCSSASTAKVHDLCVNCGIEDRQRRAKDRPKVVVEIHRRLLEQHCKDTDEQAEDDGEEVIPQLVHEGEAKWAKFEAQFEDLLGFDREDSTDEGSSSSWSDNDFSEVTTPNCARRRRTSSSNSDEYLQDYSDNEAESVVEVDLIDLSEF